MEYQFVRKTNIRKKPPLYDLQQIALQQKRHNNNQVEYEFDDDFVNVRSTTTATAATTTTSSFNIDDIFFKHEIEKQQQEEIIAKIETNPFCDNKNSYFSINEEDPFNHNTRIQHQLQQQQQTINNAKQQKFTPLALAAHATAMAVLQKDYHFNNNNDNHNHKRVSFNDGFQQSQQNIFNIDNNQFNDDEDDDWYNGGLEWRSYASTTNENENPNDIKYNSIIGQQQQQTPSKSEYNQNSIYDVYNTNWCTNDLHKYNQYKKNDGLSNKIYGGNGDGNFTYMDKSTSVNSTSSTFKK